MKKITAFLLAVLLIAAGIFGFSGTISKAASASFSVSVSNPSATVGDTVTVTVTFNTDVQATAQFSLGYNASILSPNGATNGLFENSAEGTSQSFSFTVVGAGSTAITASGSGATLGSTPGPLTVGSGSASFSGSAPVAPTEPTPTPTEPTTTTPPTTQPPTPETEPSSPAPTVPTAPAPSSSDSNSNEESIAASIAESIRASEAEAESIRNSIAASEAASREESIQAELESQDSETSETNEEETEETEETTEDSKKLEQEQESAAIVAFSTMLVDGKATTVDGKTLEMAETLDGIDLPSGYSISKISQGGQEYEVAKGKNGLILYYLMDGDKGEFYLFDDDENVFYPYVSITSGSETYVILKPGKSIKIPGNLKSADLTIDGKSVSAWQSDDADDASIYIVFAADSKGQRGFYRYNEKEKTLTAYSSSGTSAVDTSTAAGSAASQNTKKNAEADHSSLFTILKVIACVVAILIVALVAVLILRKKSHTTYDGDDGSDSDYEDDYDEDDGLMDFDHPGVSSDTMDLFDVQDMEPQDTNPDPVPDSASFAPSSPHYSSDSMIDMEALSKALSDVHTNEADSDNEIGNTQKLEAISRELGRELYDSQEPAADDDDFDITKFDD